MPGSVRDAAVCCGETRSVFDALVLDEFVAVEGVRESSSSRVPSPLALEVVLGEEDSA